MLCGDLNASDSNRDAAIEIMYDNTRHAEVREAPYICSDITNLCATDTLWSAQSLAQKGRTGYVMARSFTRTSGMPRALSTMSFPRSNIPEEKTGLQVSLKKAYGRLYGTALEVYVGRWAVEVLLWRVRPI